jgi:hypothetical protein
MTIMSKDKLITDALRNQFTDELPAEFNNVLMQKINADLVKRRKRNTFINYLSVVLTSLLLIGLSVFMLGDYLLTGFLSGIKNMFIVTVSGNLIRFSIYISTIVLLLLIMDSYFRNLHQKHLNKSSE